MSNMLTGLMLGSMLGNSLSNTSRSSSYYGGNTRVDMTSNTQVNNTTNISVDIPNPDPKFLTITNDRGVVTDSIDLGRVSGISSVVVNESTRSLRIWIERYLESQGHYAPHYLGGAFLMATRRGETEKEKERRIENEVAQQKVIDEYDNLTSIVRKEILSSESTIYLLTLEMSDKDSRDKLWLVDEESAIDLTKSFSHYQRSSDVKLGNSYE